MTEQEWMDAIENEDCESGYLPGLAQHGPKTRYSGPMAKSARPTEPKPPSPPGEADDLEYSEEWAAEIDRRAHEISSGQVQGIPWEEVRARIKAKYGWD